jgi:putative peptidoglycan lipid II flippase
VFGASEATDAYMVAYTFPYFLQSVLGVALVTGVVPAISQYLVKEARDEAWSVTSSVMNFMALLFLGVTVAGMLAADEVVRAMAPGFTEEQSLLAAHLARIMFPSLVFGGVGMVAGAALNAGFRFAAPAAAPAVANLMAILAVVGFGRRYFIYALAWGTLLGFLASFLVQLPSLRKIGFTYRWHWRLRHPDVGRVLGQLPPVVLATSVNQICLATNRFLASGLPGGSITALDLANRVVNLPLAILATSLSTALFPNMSRQAARGDLPGLSQTAEKGLAALLVLLVPVSVVLMLLRYPVVRVLFERGVFDAGDTALTAAALGYFSVGLAGMGASLLLTRACYALGDAGIPTVGAITAIGANLLLSLPLRDWLGSGGLALANSLAAITNATVLLILVRRRLPMFGLRGLTRTLRLFPTLGKESDASCRK